MTRSPISISRGAFLAMAGVAPFTLGSPAEKHFTPGLELWTVRDELAKDLPGTLRAVARMGYKHVEFFGTYLRWTPEYAKEVRKLLDDLGISCPSTHNSPAAFTTDGLQEATELNHILGSKTIIMASADRVTTLDGWKAVAEQLTRAAATLKPLGIRAGFHNHKIEFVAIEGKRPMDVLASNTPKEVTLQLDVGWCLDAGADPIAWIKANPGRIRSIHCKDWGAANGHRVLFGEGDAPWKKIFKAAESVGGLDQYLIEQEGSRYPSLETAERCLANWKKLRDK